MNARARRRGAGSNPPPARSALGVVRRALAALLLAGCAAAMLGGCAEPPPPHRGPIVLITIDTLRADVVGALGGEPGLTPALDRLAAESDWAERAIAASSWTLPSMASIFTGMQPWRHGNWHSERSVLAEELVTLPEALRAAGFRTAAFRSNPWLRAKMGYAQGFEEFRSFGGGNRARNALRALDGSAEFVWIHVLPPHSPYVLREALMDRIAEPPPLNLPQKVRAADLEQYFDPERRPPPEVLAQYWYLYRLNVAHADNIVGSLLDALRESGQWEDALIIVTSDHGEEFDENRQMTHGGNLHRVLVEVPLLIKLPSGRSGALSPRADVANSRIYATLLELAGVSLPETEGILPSLLERSDPPALSELYLGNGKNTFSLLTGSEQLVLESRFAPADPEYHPALRREMGLEPTPEDARNPFPALSAAFARSRPVSGHGESPHRGWRCHWLEPDGVECTEPREGAAARDLFEAVLREWTRWNGEETVASERGAVSPELTPEEKARLEALGYVVR